MDQRKNLSRFLALLLSAAMLLALAACGGKGGGEPDGGKPSGAAETGAQQPDQPDASIQEETPAPEKPAEFTLDTTEVRLLCLEGEYMALALLNCPKTDYGLQICDKDGNELGVYMYDQYRGITLKNGLWLADTEAWLPEYGAEDFSVLVTDSTHKQADGSNAEKLFTGIAPMTAEEMADAGLFAINGYGAFASVGKIYSTSSSAEFNVVVYMFCDGGIDSLENPGELFRFYAEDGTPLEELLSGYVLEVDVRAPYVNARFYQDANHSSLTDQDGLVAQLESCKPYMTFTGTDGMTWTLPLVAG